MDEFDMMQESILWPWIDDNCEDESEESNYDTLIEDDEDDEEDDDGSDEDGFGDYYEPPGMD